MKEEIRIEFLADNRNLIDFIEQFFIREWQRYYGPDGPGNARKDLEECCNKIELPIALIAIKNQEFYGTIALKSKSASHHHLKPWATALYIIPEKRRMGIGTQLVKTIETLAKDIGYNRIYARSGAVVDFFIKIGWVPIDRINFQGQELTVFHKDLKP